MHLVLPTRSLQKNIKVRPELFFSSSLNNIALHLCFEQAQPKMYHSPKVDEGVDVFIKVS